MYNYCIPMANRKYTPITAHLSSASARIFWHMGLSLLVKYFDILPWSDLGDMTDPILIFNSFCMASKKW